MKTNPCGTAADLLDTDRFVSVLPSLMPARINVTDAGWVQAVVHGVVVQSRYGEARVGEPDIEGLVQRINDAAPPAAPAAQPVAPQKYDDTLLPFLQLMRAELHANAAKGDRPGWLTMDRSTALLEIYWHTAKLSAACKNDDFAAIAEHSADVANMAMMLADVCRVLPALATPPAAPESAAAMTNPQPDGGYPGCDVCTCPAGYCHQNADIAAATGAKA